MRENPKCKYKQGRLRFKQDQLAILRASHNQRSQL